MDGTTTTTSASTAGETSSVNKGLSCNTCGASFERNEDQRDHMRSEWHVYNLKRSIASLLPISQSVFKERLGNERIQVGGTTQDTSSFFKKCPGCQKEFYSLKAWGNHVEKSRCTREIELELGLEGGMEALALDDHGDGEEKEEVSEDHDSEADVKDGKTEDEEQKPFDPSNCLFCSHIAETPETNISHMHKAHGLFIPDQEYLIDITSLLSYFHTIINDFHECLYCGKDLSNRGGAVRMHMVSKGHCNINLDNVSEIEDFYDFDGSEAGDGEEEVEKESGKGKSKQTDDPDSKLLIPQTDGTIQLPSGKTLGHRSHAHTYRQNTRNYRGTPSERLARQKLAIEVLRSKSKAISDANDPESSVSERVLGGKEKVSMAIEKLSMERIRGFTTREVVRRKTDAMSLVGLTEGELRVVLAIERKMARKEIKYRNELRWNLEKEGNQQKTFRPDGLGRPNGVS